MGTSARWRGVGRQSAVLVLGVAGLVTLAACAGQPAPAFHPAGTAPSASTPPSATPRPASAAVRASAPSSTRSGLLRNLSVRFSFRPPASAKKRAVIAGYENYARSFWSAIVTHGTNRQYETFMAGNALTFTRKEIKYFTSNNLTVAGTVRYSDIKITNMYFGAGAVLTACVDLSGVSRVKSATGRRVGTVYSGKYQHYLEQVVEGESANGSWNVIQTGSYPSTSSEGAPCQ